MISYDHSEAPIRARGERGRGNSRKTAIGFRRRFIRVAHRSGNSSGRGETATSNLIYGMNDEPKDNPGHAMTRDEYAEAFAFLERLRDLVPGATIIEVRSGKVANEN